MKKLLFIFVAMIMTVVGYSQNLTFTQIPNPNGGAGGNSNVIVGDSGRVWVFTSNSDTIFVKKYTDTTLSVLMLDTVIGHYNTNTCDILQYKYFKSPSKGKEFIVFFTYFNYAPAPIDVTNALFFYIFDLTDLTNRSLPGHNNTNILILDNSSQFGFTIASNNTHDYILSVGKLNNVNGGNTFINYISIENNIIGALILNYPKKLLPTTNVPYELFKDTITWEHNFTTPLNVNHSVDTLNNEVNICIGDYVCVVDTTFGLDKTTANLTQLPPDVILNYNGYNLYNNGIFKKNDTSYVWLVNYISNLQVSNYTIYSASINNGMLYVNLEDRTIVCQLTALNEAITNTDDYVNMVSIYPNPTTDYINIQNTDVIQNVMVYDLSGKIIMNQNINTNQTTLSVSDLKNGVYVMMVYTNGTKPYITKFIKN